MDTSNDSTIRQVLGNAGTAIEVVAAIEMARGRVVGTRIPVGSHGYRLDVYIPTAKHDWRWECEEISRALGVDYGDLRRELRKLIV